MSMEQKLKNFQKLSSNIRHSTGCVHEQVSLSAPIKLSIGLDGSAGWKQWSSQISSILFHEK